MALSRALLTVAASVLLIAATPGSAEAACLGESASASELTTDQYELTVLCLVNERRTSMGKSTLEVNPALTRAAVRQSEAMIIRGFFSHRWPSGKSLDDRIDASGYLRSADRWSFGENLAWGYGRRSTPLSIVDGWMNSPPHRENLLRARFRDIGIAARMGTPGGPVYPGAVTVTNEYGFRER